MPVWKVNVRNLPDRNVRVTNECDLDLKKLEMTGSCFYTKHILIGGRWQIICIKINDCQSLYYLKKIILKK